MIGGEVRDSGVPSCDKIDFYGSGSAACLAEIRHCCG